jgi:hypothetical protein
MVSSYDYAFPRREPIRLDYDWGLRGPEFPTY